MIRLVPVLLLSATAVLAQPAAYPSKSPRFVVPFAPGGPTDVVARIVGQKLGEAWGQTVVVDNRPGAGGNIGVQLAKGPPDGYTVLVTSSSIAVNMTLTAAPGYDVQKDFIAVVNVARSPNMIVTGASGPATLRQLIEQARPGGIVYGSAGTGTTPHITAEYLFRNLAGLRTTHVPYKGAAPAVTAVLGGEVRVASVAMPTAVPYIKSGRLRGLAITSERRAAALPEVPTVAESGFPGLEDYTWVGVFVPTGTPGSIVARLNSDVNAVLGHADSRERLASLGFEPVGGTAASFASFVQAEVAKWARMVKETGARLE